jgi:hypothetical protein
MPDPSAQPRNALFRIPMGEFWSGDIGLTLVTISLTMLVFVLTPLREAGVSGRAVLDSIIMALMVGGALAVKQNRIDTILVITLLAVTTVVLSLGRLHPTLVLHQFGSVLSTITLLLYVRIVLLVMFRAGPITWGRVQGVFALICFSGWPGPPLSRLSSNPSPALFISSRRRRILIN